MKQNIILPEKVTRTVAVTQEIDPKQWVRVNGTKYFVNKSQAVNGFTWENALRQTLTTTPFRVTPPSIFMPHYTQVCSIAVKKRNPIVLYDGAGEPLSRSARDDLYERRTTNTWVHLDARFELRGDKLWMLTDHVLVNDELQPTTQQPLERRVLRENGFVELQWNNQGLPVKKSRAADYKLGKNLKYIAPDAGSVVWFGAISDRFYLYCYRDLQGSNAAFGVLFCAEGAAKKK